jgi:hypothetical protein
MLSLVTTGRRFIGIAATFALFTAGEAGAAVLATYNGSPQTITTTVNGATVVTFDSLPLGVNSNVPLMDGATQVGTFDLIRVLSGGPYGGANASQYITPVDPQTTLTFASSAHYLGIWWSAGDQSNVIDFFSGSTLVAEFTTANLLQALPAAYYGNPSGPYQGSDPTEPFAYLNFFATGSTSWDSVTFRNGQFESDNYSSRSAVWNPGVEGVYPGVIFESIDGTTEEAITATPEPATIGPCGMMLLLIAFGCRRARQ